MQRGWHHRVFGLLLIIAMPALASTSPKPHAAGAHEHHEGCSMHHPLVQQQHAVLQRRLQQLRTDTAAAAATVVDSMREPSLAPKAKQHQEPQPAKHKQLSGSTAASSHSNRNRILSGSKDAVAAPVRINPVYQLSGLSADDTKRVKQQLVPAAFKVLQKFVKVIRPAGGVLKVDAFFGDGQQGCLISRVDGNLAQGKRGAKDTDLLMYISSDKDSCLPGMIAIATACDVDPITKRPILGSLNICGDALKGLSMLKAGSDAEQTAIGRVVEVLVHETVHVLGFGSTHYEDWRGPNGKPYGANKVIQNINGRPFLTTPKVTAVARRYFGCDKLPGAPLENEGPSFSATSHFEYRLLQRELMSPARPIDRSRARLSAFTLAALEDTGWYKTDTNDAEALDWGRSAGCDFVLNTCWNYIAKNNQQPYYCGKGSINQTRCTAEAAGWGVCRTNAFSDGCLLVGKYSQNVAAAATAGLPPSSEDGRQAACYSPPQLAALNRGGPKESLLPLLGGSYGAQRNDICYNLVREQPTQQEKVVWVNGHGQIPEDVGKSPPKTAPPAGASLPQQQQQRASGANARLPATATAGAYEPAVLPLMDGGTVAEESSATNTKACVRMTPKKASNMYADSWRSMGKRLLSLSASLGRGLSDLSSGTGRELTSVSKATASSATQATNSFLSVQSIKGTSAACVESPILCFNSSCDSSGRLWISAQHSLGTKGKFTCPSGQTVDLSRQLPGRYLSGYLQCPSNALVCKTSGCGECSVSGGYCSRGKCYCHMERFGPGCKNTLVPQLK